jgi:hypothetical protein
MLEGVRANEIIVGAYTDRKGGVCPMLAAHRRGGRTSLASFARAWDRYTEAESARRATERELRTLRAMLEASLWHDPEESDLAEVVAELRARGAARAAEKKLQRRETGERNRSRELRPRPGWAWLRVFRRLDDWEAALARAEEQQADQAAARLDRRERDAERV